MTTTELKLAALRKLKVIGSGEPANSADFALMGEQYEALHAMLLEKSLVTWALDEDIPAKVRQPVIAMLAALSAEEFGVPQPRLGSLILEGGLDLPQASLAERQLRKALAGNYVSHPLRTQYF